MAVNGSITLPILNLSARAYRGSAPECVVVNTKTFVVSEYLNYGFNSMTRFNGVNLIADQNGIYAQDTSSLDDSSYKIKSTIKSGIFDVYTDRGQKLRNAWVNYVSDGNIKLSSVGDETAKREYTLVYNPDADGVREGRIKFERGIRNRTFDFALSNVDGSDIEIESMTITLEPVVSRKG
jgi:hypothetical protein